jgi:hypothetical protein
MVTVGVSHSIPLEPFKCLVSMPREGKTAEVAMSLLLQDDFFAR